MELSTVTAPQQARSRQSRRRLLEATTSCLVEHGYAGTTTGRVARAAGLSQGALFKHFPNKAALLAAATEALFESLIDEYRRAFSDVAPGSDDPLTDALDLLWQVFVDAPLQAAFELYVASRTDAELRAALLPVLEQHSSNLRNEAAALFPDAARHRDFDSVIAGIMATMQGAALTGVLYPGPEGTARELSFLYRVVRSELCRLAGEAS